MGRPSSFSEEIADRICDGIANGKSLIKVCSEEDMPGVTTVLRWVAKGELGDEQYLEFRNQYAHAMHARADYMAEEQIEIADASAADLMADENGNIDPIEHIQRAKLRIDTRKWLMGKMKPKKYGERITAEHTGADGGPIATTNAIDLSTLSVEQLTALSGIANSLNPAAREPDGD